MYDAFAARTDHPPRHTYALGQMVATLVFSGRFEHLKRYAAGCVARDQFPARLGFTDNWKPLLRIQAIVDRVVGANKDPRWRESISAMMARSTTACPTIQID